jgi:protein TonB
LTRKSRPAKPSFLKQALTALMPFLSKTKKTSQKFSETLWGADPRVLAAAKAEKEAFLPRIAGSPVIPDFILPVERPKGLSAFGLSPLFTKILLVSIGLHALVITTVTFREPIRALIDRAQTMDVVIVNAKSRSAPQKADVLAQANLDGGGNVDEDIRAKTPLPVLHDKQPQIQQEQEAKPQEQKTVTQILTRPPEPNSSFLDKVKESLKESESDKPAVLNKAIRKIEIMHLEAQLDKELEAFQKRPKKKFIGTRAEEYRFARYVEDWRLIVEDWGNRHYPEAARRNKIYGSLQMTVAISKDGTVHPDTVIDQLSGNKILDAAAIKIVDDAGPYKPFPPEIAQDTDILYITRTWTFSPVGLRTEARKR